MRVAIAEDSGIFRQALVDALTMMNVEVTASVDNVDDMRVALRADLPDAVILDICMPPTKTDEGVRAAEEFGVTYPKLGILVLSSYVSMPHVVRVLGSGRRGVGCLSKDQVHDTEMLVRLLEGVVAGENVVDPQFALEHLMSGANGQVLTAREEEVLRAVAEGYSNRGIADRLYISVKTVESTLSSIFRKLDVNGSDANPRVKAALQYLLRPSK